MMSMLFCKCGGGIITAQESGQERSQDLMRDNFYIYTDRMIKKIVSIDPKFNELIKSIVVAYQLNSHVSHT